MATEKKIRDHRLEDWCMHTPAEGERYYLRVLLNHVRGATSFDDLKTVNGKACGSFREACEQLGLIEHDRTLDDCMTEAATFQMPSALRRLFATILVFCEATQIRQLWDKHLASMSEDYRRTQSNEAALEQMVLRDIRDLLHPWERILNSMDFRIWLTQMVLLTLTIQR